MLHFKGKATFKCKQCGHQFEAFDTEGGIIAGPILPHCPFCDNADTIIIPYSRSYIHFVLLLLLGLVVVSCSKDSKTDSKSDSLTPDSVMNVFFQLSPEDGAKYYKENRNTYHFLDSLYGDSIVPALQYCNFYELKEVCTWLKNTPYFEDAFEFCQNAKEVYLQSINKELTEFISYEQNVFKETILPAIELEIDSMLEKDIKKTMSNYAGGLLNYRKLNFLFGRGRNDFKEMFWDKFDLEKYQERIAKHIQNYLDTISNKQNQYCMEITGKAFDERMSIDYPELRIGLSKSTLKHIQQYTKQQSDEITTDIIKDWVTPAILASASGGLSTLYDIGTFAYDIKVTLDDIKEEKIDPDDMVRYVCSHDLSYQIDNYYLNQCLEKVNISIKESNKKLIDKISQSL